MQKFKMQIELIAIKELHWVCYCKDALIQKILEDARKESKQAKMPSQVKSCLKLNCFIFNCEKALKIQ